MITRKTLAALSVTALFASSSALYAQGGAPVKFDIKPNGKGVAVSSTMYGLFFEDINYGADGGLYAEKIKNRSFDFPQALLGWTTFGNVDVLEDGPFERNPNYVRLSPSGHREKYSGLENEGFFGVSVEKGATYRCSLYGRVPDGKTSKIRVEIENPASDAETQVIASKEIEISGKDWKKYTVELQPGETLEKGRFRIMLLKPENIVDLEHISLFPTDTYNGHENGLRKDLAQKLADIHPGVFRFPGGCIVESTGRLTRTAGTIPSPTVSILTITRATVSASMSISY